MSEIYINTSILAQQLATRIKLNQYLADHETHKYSGFLGDAVGSFHQFGLILYRNGNDRSYYLNVQKIWEFLGIESLIQTFGDELESFKFKLAESDLYVMNTDLSVNVGIGFREIIGAYVFFNIAQAQSDFIGYLKNYSDVDLQSASIIKVPNPFLGYFLKNVPNVLHSNFILCTCFSLMALAISHKSTEQFKPKGSYDEIEPAYGRNTVTLTNCAKTAQKNGYKLSCLEVDAAIQESHIEKFILTQGYGGYDADDWVYYRVVSGKVADGTCRGCYAISPSLGIRRSINIAEYYNMCSFKPI